MIAERGYALHAEGRHREAAIVFEGLVAIDPDDRYARDALAAACLALGEPHRALEHLDILLHQDPSDLNARSRRAEARLEAGDVSGALSDLDQLRHLLPSREVRRLELHWEAARKRATLSRLTR